MASVIRVIKSQLKAKVYCTLLTNMQRIHMLFSIYHKYLVNYQQCKNLILHKEISGSRVKMFDFVTCLVNELNVGNLPKQKNTNNNITAEPR